MSSMKIGGITFDHHQVLEMVAGYAFSDARITLQPPTGRDYGTPPSPRVGQFPYRSFDCAPRSTGELDVNDILVVAGLGTTMDAPKCLAALGVAPAVSEAIGRIPLETKFWNLPRAEIGTDAPVNSMGWHLNRARWLLMSAPRLGPSDSDQILHHKRPATFPILDELTSALLPDGDAWPQIHDDLNTYADEFESIEWMFGRLAEDHQGIRLTRLRIYDIALWCHVTGQGHIAGELGRRLLDRVPA